MRNLVSVVEAVTNLLAKPNIVCGLCLQTKLGTNLTTRFVMVKLTPKLGTVAFGS